MRLYAIHTHAADLDPTVDKGLTKGDLVTEGKLRRPR
jgi:hypothetical protein